MSQLEDSAAPAPGDDYEDEAYEEEYEQPVALSPWAVIACILGVIAVFITLPTKGGFFVGLFAIIAATAARHDINRGLKSGSGWAKAGTWLGGIAMVGSAALTFAAGYNGG